MLIVFVVLSSFWVDLYDISFLIVSNFLAVYYLCLIAKGIEELSLFGLRIVDNFIASFIEFLQHPFWINPHLKPFLIEFHNFSVYAFFDAISLLIIFNVFVALDNNPESISIVSFVLSFGILPYFIAILINFLSRDPMGLRIILSCRTCFDFF